MLRSDCRERHSAADDSSRTWRRRGARRERALAVEIPYWGQSLLRVLGGIVAVLLPAGTIVYVFLFKMMSFMQSRLGPMEAGPYGSMQLFAEVGKWLQKEDTAPEAADHRIFKMAPLIVLVSTFLLVAARAVRARRLADQLRRRRLLRPRRVVDQRARHPRRRLGRAPTSTRCSAACGPPAS